MKKISPISLAILLSFACNLDDLPPSNELGDYNLPPKVATEIFTDDVLAITGSLEPFLDQIKSEGMDIHQGTSPRAIFQYCDDKLPCPQSYQVNHDCLYDSRYPSHADSTFGRYQDNILIQENTSGGYDGSLAYYSLAGDSLYREGFDTGSGSGAVSGDNASFTLFVKVENGKYDNVNSGTLWIVSGETTGQLVSRFQKCMVLLSKTGDSKNQMANIGTIRIFESEVIDPIEP